MQVNKRTAIIITSLSYTLLMTEILSHGIFNGFRSFKFSLIIFVFVNFVTFSPAFLDFTRLLPIQHGHRLVITTSFDPMTSLCLPQ